MNQAFCNTNPSQTKALFDIHQVHDFQVSINNCAKCNQKHDGASGMQSICTPKGTFESHFDDKNASFK